MTCRIVIVDDHPLVREGLIDVFSDHEDFEIIGEGACAADAIRLALSVQPDLILLDVNMPGGGLHAAERIAQEEPGTRIAMFSFRQDHEVVRACLRAGAAGYIVKGTSAPDLVAAVRSIMAGNTYLDPRLASLSVS